MKKEEMKMIPRNAPYSDMKHGHTNILTYMHTQDSTHRRQHTHAHTHTQTHTHSHTYIHTHPHTHKYIQFDLTLNLIGLGCMECWVPNPWSVGGVI